MDANRPNRGIHPRIRHNQFMWVNSTGNVRNVACRTCGFIEPYSADKHQDVLNLENLDEPI